MFTESAHLYDLIYSFKDYDAEAARVRELVMRAGGPGEGTLLDVACGTGKHAAAFRAHYRVEGVDLDENLLAEARRRLPDVAFHHGDMRDFDLGRRFDMVTCLFSSIGYVRTEEGLRAAVANLARHVRPGGALVIEPWLSPDRFIDGTVDMRAYDEPGLKVARVTRCYLEDGMSVIHFHYLIGTPAEVTHAEERHVTGLFTRGQMTNAMESAGLRVTYDAEGLMGRGLYVGIAAEE